jgi:DNA-binding XRE family transcriptional regulator
MVLISKADFDRMENAIPRAAIDAARAYNAASKGEGITGDEIHAWLESPLEFWRNKRGLTQVEIAHAAGISRSYVAGLESGARKGDPALFKRLAAALRAPLEDIVTD